MKTKNKTWFSNHSHVWIVIIGASILAIVFINWLPNEKIFSSILIGLVASHTLILLITLFGGWMLLPEKFLAKFGKKTPADAYNFGWSVKWSMGFGFASFIVALLAFYFYYVLEGIAIWQLVVFTFLLLLAINFFIGNIIAKASQSEAGLVLPYVDLFKTGRSKVLDAGCGAGRTTISLAKVAPDFTIVAFDRFDAKYIDEGGKALLRHNIELAGITQRVAIEQGDITEMPFTDNSFDAAVSSFMYDHLGENKLIALKEMWRVLKPGGRFLLIIIVRGYSSFAIANVLSFAFPGREYWRQLFTRSNFKLVDEGDINFGAYFLIEKPIEDKASHE